MRELKFRAWDTVTKRMYLPDVQPGPVMYLNGCLALDHTWVTGEFVLMQFTGLKDKNGKEIYEGDVILLLIEDVPYPFEVLWEHGHMRFGLRDMEGEIEHDSWAFTPHNDFEIIGNIHENPELIK